MLRAICLGLIACTLTLGGTGSARAADDVMVIFDGSNSMWGQIDGTAKIEIARDAMTELVGAWDKDTNLGLMAYGHRREADCSDIETIIPPRPMDRDAFMSNVEGIVPRGKTPLTSAIEQAAETLSYRDNPATVVVISDGIESCNRDPCALAGQLKRSGVRFTAHVIGFGLDSAEEQKGLACIAEETGGRFLTAANAGELRDAFKEVGSEVTQAAPEPEPEPEPTEDIEVTAPASIPAGGDFEASWSKTLDDSDILTIVPTGADDDQIGNHERASDGNPVTLRAPAETGMYEVRYVSNEGREVLGSASVEVTDPQVEISAPDSVTRGGELEVSWSGTVNGRDILTIVPAGSDDDRIGNHERVNDGNPVTLRAPAEPGMYEARYVLDEGRRVLASVPVEVTDAQVQVSAPDSVVAGSSFEVSWSGTVNGRDILTIVPAGSDDDRIGNHERVNDGKPVTLRAPAEPGMYEARYVLDEGRRVLASVPVEVTDAQVQISAPDSVVAGSSFEVSWSGTVSGRDILTIVPMGAEADEIGNHERVNDGNPAKLRAPGKPGLYQVRYVLDEGRRPLADATVEVTEPDVSVSATDTVRAKGEIEVSWTGTAPSGRDIITVVPAGSEEDEIGNHERVGDGDATTLRAPEKPGLYEVRYVLDEGRRMLASTQVEIVPETAALDAGASLDVPKTASPGEEIQVGWTGGSDSADQRIALAKADQADFTWIEVHKVGNEPPMSFTMPDAPGSYEFRFLDIPGQAVLSRAIIEVK
ncbi:VWA domain-containing protein [Amorphus orientalis]|uniref:Ca-activated chloride channel family protein n=1 Tax=Amorphus orientalis TaxID=649198 RepID=A0AAE4ASG7_9HYPH|nr:VWA domain-containing protein [Amorphus orientalis]MDQ0315015.1 Ca-activated chloride channel family protein [Amorphus orientalis]